MKKDNQIVCLIFDENQWIEIIFQNQWWMPFVQIKIFQIKRGERIFKKRKYFLIRPREFPNLNGLMNHFVLLQDTGFRCFFEHQCDSFRIGFALSNCQIQALSEQVSQAIQFENVQARWAVGVKTVGSLNYQPLSFLDNQTYAISYLQCSCNRQTRVIACGICQKGNILFFGESQKAFFVLGDKEKYLHDLKIHSDAVDPYQPWYITDEKENFNLILEPLYQEENKTLPHTQIFGIAHGSLQMKQEKIILENIMMMIAWGNT